jgi:predicted patatin/cPLA2 family phospholipase
MFMNGKKTLGESKNLLKLIRNNFTPRDFYDLQKSGKEVVVTVANLSVNDIEYKSSNKCTYDEFTDWVWISANMVPYMSLVIRNGHEYADGGFGNFVPIKRAIEQGATDIDAIVLKTNHSMINTMRTRNVLDLFLKLFGFMINQIALDDIDMARMVGKNEKVRINFYFIPNVLTDNPLIFNPRRMTRWWEEGFEFAKTEKPVVEDSRNWILSFFGE